MGSGRTAGVSVTSDPHTSLNRAIDALPGARVGVVGDLVADLYVSGQSDRVSREAPVLILRHEKEWLRPGGAANVAANIAALGARAVLVGVVGEDDAGRRLLEMLGDTTRGEIISHAVSGPRDRATITKTRFLAGAKLTSRQQVLRLDREPSAPLPAATLAALRERVAAADADVDAWVVSDYGYGSFDTSFRSWLREAAGRKPVLIDSRYGLTEFRGATLIKPNEEEAEAAARTLRIDATEPEALVRALAARLEASACLVTLGNKGMLLAEGARVTHVPAVGSEEIVDLTGAGDSVAAALTAALACGADTVTACRLANHAGGIVVMKEGAATASPEELRASVASREPLDRGRA